MSESKLNRRNFLAFMPSIAAIPFFATNIIETESGILVQDPKPIIKSHKGFNWMDAEIQVVHDGNVLGRGYLTELSMAYEIFGPREISVSGKLLNLSI